MHFTQVAFAIVAIGGGIYFVLANRSFDLFLIAFGGALFYFCPLLVGYFPNPGERGSTSVIPGGAYAVGIPLIVAITVGAVMFDRLSPWNRMANDERNKPRLYNWYLVFAAIGLIQAARTGAIFNLNKLEVLEQVGYWFVLFEIAAGLAVVDAFFHRAHLQLACGIMLLLADLFIGFRMMTVMATFACTLIAIGRSGPCPAWRNSIKIGSVVFALLAAMLGINPIRYALLPTIGVTFQVSDADQKSQVSNADQKSQVSDADQKRQVSDADQESQAIDLAEDQTTLQRPVGILERLAGILERKSLLSTEPFVTQAILSEIVRHDYACTTNRFLYFGYVIPFMGHVLGQPTTFESEFKPLFFPKETYGMASNIWAEAFCQYGYLGTFTAILFFVALIAAIQFAIVRAPASMISALALGGVLCAFYVHRNDFLFEILLIRRVAMVFILALIAAKIASIVLTGRAGVSFRVHPESS
jgi:hypothetical protein